MKQFTLFLIGMVTIIMLHSCGSYEVGYYEGAYYRYHYDTPYRYHYHIQPRPYYQPRYHYSPQHVRPNIQRRSQPMPRR